MSVHSRSPPLTHLHHHHHKQHKQHTRNENTQPHSVPTVHLDAAAGRQLLAAYASNPSGVRATISKARIDVSDEAPSTAGFSGRGPSVTDGTALLKPDISAPGVGVFAAFPAAAAEAAAGANTTGVLLSGTSMAAPHVAGAAALLRQAHPDWSPAAVKSALVTTASRLTNKGRALGGTPFDYGAGQVDVARALDPGLVYDAGEVEYQRYVCTSARYKGASTLPSYCKAACGATSRLVAANCRAPQGFRNYNAPSFSLPGFKGSRNERMTATRVVTYVGAPAATSAGVTLTPTLQLPPGWTGSVAVERWPSSKAQPSTTQLQFGLPLARNAGPTPAYGQQRRFTLTIAAVGPTVTPYGWSFGTLTWADASGRYSVRSTIAMERVYK